MEADLAPTHTSSFLAVIAFELSAVHRWTRNRTGAVKAAAAFMKSAIQSPKAAATVGPYSQAIVVGNLVFASGQLPINPQTGTIPEDIEAQTRLSLSNLGAVLAEGGASFASVTKTTVFLKNMDDFAIMNRVYAEHFVETPPARSTIEVARLPRDALIEIEAIAILDEQSV